MSHRHRRSAHSIFTRLQNDHCHFHIFRCHAGTPSLTINKIKKHTHTKKHFKKEMRWRRGETTEEVPHYRVVSFGFSEIIQTSTR